MVRTLAEWESELVRARNDPYVYFKDEGEELHKKIQRSLHPDRYFSPNQSVQAAALFKEFNFLYEGSRNPVKIGNYRVIDQLAKGDLSVVSRVVKSGKHFLIKEPVKANKAITKIVLNEANIVKNLNKYLEAVPLAKAVPSYVETINDSCNVFSYRQGLETLESVKARYPKGLHPRHVGWIVNRMLSIAGICHNFGIAHGAITPSHVLIDKITHEAQFCGWIHANNIGETIKLVPAKWISMYPSFVKDSKRLSVALDNYMIAKTAFWLADADLPSKLKGFLQGLLAEGQHAPNNKNAWELQTDWGELLVKVFGQKQFYVLE